MEEKKEYVKCFFSTGSVRDYLKFKAGQPKQNETKHIDAFLNLDKKDLNHECI